MALVRSPVKPVTMIKQFTPEFATYAILSSRTTNFEGQPSVAESKGTHYTPPGKNFVDALTKDVWLLGWGWGVGCNWRLKFFINEILLNRSVV